MTDIQTLTVYLGSSGHTRAVFREEAVKLGRLIGSTGYHLVYGGMDAGLMGLLAIGAIEARGAVTGIVPQNLKDSERILPGLRETILVPTLWERKRRMFEMADAVIAMPGGFGTLDETLEMLYWGYLGLHAKPLVLVNVEGYWNDIHLYLQGLPDYDPRFLITVDRVEDIVPAMRAARPPLVPSAPPHYPHFEDEILRDTTEPIVIDKADIQNSYYAACALGLKQLGKHARAIGFLNENGRFDDLLNWFRRAGHERFITPKCLALFTAARDRDELMKALSGMKSPTIDLHKEKWGRNDIADTI